MHSPLEEAALDPACLMCLVPWDNGMWLSHLRPDGQPWVSAPRNFAEEPMRWYELADVFRSIGTIDDFEHGIVFELFDGSYNTITWFPLGNRPSSLIVNGYGTLYWYNQLGKTAGSDYINLNASGLTITGPGIYEIRGSVVGNVATLYLAELDHIGNIIRSKTNQTTITERNTTWDSDAYMISQFPGTFKDAWVSRNGKRIWSYPSRAEFLRLFTRAAVRTDRGVFEAANPSGGWTLETAVPANVTGTVLAKLNGAVVTNPTKWNRSTATFSGAATDTLEWLLVCNATLSAGQIAYLSN